MQWTQYELVDEGWQEVQKADPALDGSTGGPNRRGGVSRDGYSHWGGGAGGRSPPPKARAAGKFWEYRVLETIFYRRLMPASRPQSGRLALGPRSGTFGEYRVLKAIFYIRLMPASLDPTTFKSSDFGRFKRKGNFVSARSWRFNWRLVAVQLPGCSSERFRTQLH